MGFPGSSAGKEFACSARDPSSILGSGRFPWRRDKLPTPVFWPGESTDSTVHGVTESRTLLSLSDKTNENLFLGILLAIFRNSHVS